MLEKDIEHIGVITGETDIITEITATNVIQFNLM